MADSTVRVQVRRSGGIAGVDLVASADEAGLGEHADTARQLLAGQLTAVGPDRPAGADRFSYAVTVADGKQTRTLHWGDHEVPPAARPMIDALLRHARPGG
jgi:hypothetical protein